MLINCTGTHSQNKYSQNTNKAKERLSVGEYPQNKKVDPAEQAAFMAVAQIILNLDETITLN